MGYSSPSEYSGSTELRHRGRKLNLAHFVGKTPVWILLIVIVVIAVFIELFSLLYF